MDLRIPKTVLILSAVFGANSIFSFWNLFSASDVPVNLYLINIIWILVFGILPTIGLLLGWKAAYMFVKFLVAVLVVGSICSLVLNIGFTIGLGDTFDKMIMYKTIGSGVLAILGIALYRHLKADEITNFFANES